MGTSGRATSFWRGVIDDFRGVSIGSKGRPMGEFEVLCEIREWDGLEDFGLLGCLGGVSVEGVDL